MAKFFLTLLSLNLLTPALLQADEPKDPYTDYSVIDDDDDEGEASRPNSEPKQQVRERSYSEPELPISVGLGLSLGSGFFGASAQALFPWNEYVGFQPHIYYHSMNADPKKEVVMGGDVVLRLSLANPTMLTPYVGAGVGYESWNRQYAGETLDKSSSPVGIGVLGLDLALSRHFGLVVESRTTLYLAKQPLKFQSKQDRARNGDLKESKSQTELGIGFRFSI